MKREYNPQETALALAAIEYVREHIKTMVPVGRTQAGMKLLTALHAYKDLVRNEDPLPPMPMPFTADDVTEYAKHQKELLGNRERMLREQELNFNKLGRHMNKLLAVVKAMQEVPIEDINAYWGAK